MPVFESISTGILSNLIYDLAKKSLILFKGDFYDQISDAFNEALEQSGVINERIRNTYLVKISVFLSKKRPNRMEYSPEELAQALERSEDFGYELLGNFEIAILKRDELYKWVRNVYAKETIDLLKRILDNVEIIAERFKFKEADQIEEFAHISHLRRIKEKNIIPRTQFYDQLDDWFSKSNKAIMVLNGLGGTGKTIIAWEWKERLKQKVEFSSLEKIFIWSFYDFHANFDNFVNTLLRNDFLKNPESIKAWDISFKADELLTLLNKQKTLLILDGIEKELLAYKNITEEHYDQSQIKGDRQLRQFKNAEFRKFICELSILENCKTLITTRVIPEGFPDIEDPGYCHEISGSEIILVSQMEDNEIIAFVRAFNIYGTKHEILEVANQWYNHPLSLRLLVNHLDYKHKKEPNYNPHIKDAPSINELEPDFLKRILKIISENTPQREKLLLMQMSAFRVYSINYPMLTIFRQNESFGEFKQVIQNLYDLGLITCSANKNYKITDDTEVNIHPLIRHHFNEQLRKTEYWTETHQLLVEFFEVFLDDQNKYDTIFGKMYQAIQAAEGYKINTLNDLTPVIELYHHLIGAGKFDEAVDLFDKRLEYPTYFQLSAYNLRIELLKEFFPNGEDQPPRLKKEADQAWTLNSLANSYSLSGQPAKAVPLFLMQNKLQEKNENKKNLAIGLGNMAYMAQLHIDQLSAAAVHLRKSIALCQEIKEELYEAIGHQELGRVLAYQGRFGNRFPKAPSFRKANGSTAEDELAKAFHLFEKKNSAEWMGKVSAYRSLSALLQIRLANAEGQISNLSNVGQIVDLPYMEAHQALEFAEKDAKTVSPLPRDFIRAYWLRGESLIQIKNQKVKIKMKQLEIHFYDEHFQSSTGTEVVQAGNELAVAERCLTEALRRCRQVNLVESEADILLAWARLKWVTGKLGNQAIGQLGEVEEYLKEAKEIAERAGYRLQLADIHLFYGEVLLDIDRPQRSQRPLRSSDRLLGLTAREHLQLAKEYAKDDSKFENLYQSKDKHFYETDAIRQRADGISSISEYEMLKRGMTEQERIENGYYVAYQIAEALEKKLN